MHGRLKIRSSAEKEEQKRKENLEKLAKYQKGVSFIIQYKDLSKISVEIIKEDNDDEKTEPKNEEQTQKAQKNLKILGLQQKLLEITEKILVQQPDLTLAWNIRRNLASKLNLQNELNLTYSGLLYNPKSYGCWFHRRFCFDHEIICSNCNTSTTEYSDLLNQELENTNLFLMKDGRNFHCWDHRRWLIKKMKISIEDELKFSKKMIDFNFSNHSAWHYRSTLLVL